MLLPGNFKNKLGLPFLVILSLGLFFSCESKNGGTELISQEASQTDAPVSPTATKQAPESKVIRNASLRFQVKDFSQSLQQVQNSLKGYGAFLASSQDNRQETQLETTLEIRVPASNLDPLLNHLVKQSIYLDYRNLSSEDVTTEFVDLNSRLKAKKAVEARFLDLLHQANTIKDILQVEQELKTIREEIETMQGRLNHITTRVAYSTITLTIYEKTAGPSAANPFLVRVGNALEYGWELTLSLFIGLLYIWPFFLLAPLILLGARKWQRRYPPVR